MMDVDINEPCDDSNEVPDDGCHLCELAETEPNDTYATSTLISLGKTYRGRLPSNDQDFFAVDVENDQSYRVEVFVGETGACAMGAFPASLQMSLRQPDGGGGFVTFANADDGVNNSLGRCPFFQWRVSGSDGRRYVRLEHDAAETLEPYFIRVTQLDHNQPSASFDLCGSGEEVCDDGNQMVTDGCHFCRTSEIEATGNNPITGTFLSLPEVVVGTVNFGTDWFRFFAAEGHAYRLETFIGGVDACVASNNDWPHLEVYNDNGQSLIAEAPDNGFFHLNDCAMMQYTHNRPGEVHFIRVTNDAPEAPNDVYGLRVLDLGLVEE